MLESSIERNTCKRVEDELGIRNLKLNVRGQTGWPDRMFLIPGGKPLFIEFKRPGEDLEPKQNYVAQVLRRLGYNVEKHDNEERAFNAVARTLEASRVSKEGD